MWKYEKVESDISDDVWRVYDDSDPSYEATICELWSMEHDNESLALQICNNANSAMLVTGNTEDEDVA